MVKILENYRTLCYYTPLSGGGGEEVMQITYQKNDGTIFKRIRKTELPYKIGETTSMNWKILNIEYEYNNEYYPIDKYYALISKSKKKAIKKKKNIELYKKEVKKIIYYIIAIVIYNYLKSLIGI